MVHRRSRSRIPVSPGPRIILIASDSFMKRKGRLNNVQDKSNLFVTELEERMGDFLCQALSIRAFSLNDSFSVEGLSADW